MDFYFPIADTLYNPWIILGIGLGVGFLAGFFGLGTGILITPILLILGFPSRIAVASQLNASIGANFTGLLNYGRRKDVDYALGTYLIIGALIGALAEYYILKWLYYSHSPYGNLKLISGTVLIILSLSMFYQTLRNLLLDDMNARQITMKKWMIYIPFHRIFLRSRTEISIIVPIVVGFLTGILTISLGGGLNTMMVPFLTYLIGRISPCVTGTSFFVSTIVFCCVTFFHSIGTAPVDIFLVLLLSASTSLGTRLGSQVSYFFSRTVISLFGSIIILGLGIKTLLDVFALSKKKPKIILNNGVHHYLNDLRELMNDKLCWVTKETLIFAADDPILYTLISIFLSIIVAFGLNKMMQLIFSKRK